MQAALWTSLPLLVVAVVMSCSVSIMQVLTSIQDNTVSTVPRLITVAVATFLLAPWMLTHLSNFTRSIFTQLYLYAR